MSESNQTKRPAVQVVCYSNYKIRCFKDKHEGFIYVSEQAYNAAPYEWDYINVGFIKIEHLQDIATLPEIPPSVDTTVFLITDKYACNSLQELTWFADLRDHYKEVHSERPQYYFMDDHGYPSLTIEHLYEYVVCYPGYVNSGVDAMYIDSYCEMLSYGNAESNVKAAAILSENINRSNYKTLRAAWYLVNYLPIVEKFYISIVLDIPIQFDQSVNELTNADLLAIIKRINDPANEFCRAFTAACQFITGNPLRSEPTDRFVVKTFIELLKNRKKYLEYIEQNQ